MPRKDAEATREYNRLRAAEQYDNYIRRRMALIEAVFNNECYLCEREAGKNMHLHHIEYHPTESDYPRSGRSLYVRMKRLAEAEQNPERFRLLCAGCHRLVEGIRGMVDTGFDRRKVLELLVEN